MSDNTIAPMGDDLPPLPEPEWCESFMTNRPRLAAKWYSEKKMRDYGRLCAEQERERAAKLAERFATCPCNGKHGACRENDPPLAIASAIRAQGGTK